jgi:hypothetical protein
MDRRQPNTARRLTTELNGEDGRPLSGLYAALRDTRKGQPGPTFDGHTTNFKGWQERGT